MDMKKLKMLDFMKNSYDLSHATQDFSSYLIHLDSAINMKDQAQFRG